MEHVGNVYLPGDNLNFLSSETDQKVVLGPSLRREGEAIVALKTGMLKYREPNIFWLDSHQKHYMPYRNDDIIGQVTSKVGDFFKVDIGASEQASLSYLAFEGATKRNRPQIAIGDLVYGRLAVADSYMEPELVCVDSTGKSRGMGTLVDGFMFSVSLELARKLRSQHYEPIYEKLSQLGPFEIAVGMNGRVWVKSKSPHSTIKLSNIIELLENASRKDIDIIIHNVINS